MRNNFINCLIEQAEDDKKIFLITPDLGFYILEKFAEKFPERFLNVGIAEQNAIGIASGLALSGKHVYIYSIIPFITMRCFEQIRLDIAYMNTNVKIIGVGAGLSYGAAGTTHHSVEDIAIMRSLPNMTVCCPGDPAEVNALIKQSFHYDGPMYFRLAKSNEPVINNKEIILGKASIIKEGSDLAVITTSNMLEAGFLLINDLEQDNKKASLISMHTIKPIDKELILNLIDRNIPIITIEEHNIIGGLGSAVAEIIAESSKPAKFKRIGIPDKFSHYVGSQNFIREKMGLTNLKEKVNSILEGFSNG
ncbi:MAG: transketolase C-terminal domain-containing protein [Candidatus Gastranaerophilales bacterium]|nr:transketolase C-terminal domain-containing protein [Candidatus Gastranaerophilales bacterium]